MAREKELFRDNLLRLDAAFPGRDLLRFQEAADFLGLPAHTLRRNKDFPRQHIGRNLYISKVKLASWLS